MKVHFSVSNLRRILDIPFIELRPITIFVGRNSAGKSTLLRTFPLLKQSLATKTSAPVLWFGDYVDYGDFQTAVSGGDQRKDISFKFKISDVNHKIRVRNGRMRHKISTLKMGFELEYRIFQHSDKTKVRLIEINFPSLSSKVKIYVSNVDGIPRVEIDGEVVFEEGKEKLFFDGDNLFSTPMLTKELRGDKFARFRAIPFTNYFSAELRSFLKKSVSRSVGGETIYNEAERILNSDNLSELTIKDLSFNSNTKAFKKFYLSLIEDSENESRRYLEILRVGYTAFIALQFSEDELSDMYGRVQYLGPARARSERYYRRQELEVSEILPDGQNFPMFLASLSQSQQKSFSQWVESIFGYGIKIKNTPGHTSINLTIGSQIVNVTDTGYGVSQLLPVLGQIWWSSSKGRNYGPVRNRTFSNITPIAIEQPELHLHPAHQSLLADVFTRAVSDNEKSGLRFLIETHSESFLNKLGSLVSDGLLKSSDVQIVVFDSSDELNGNSTVKIAEYDSSGVLRNWPYGFFDYNDDFQL